MYDDIRPISQNAVFEGRRLRRFFTELLKELEAGHVDNVRRFMRVAINRLPARLEHYSDFAESAAADARLGLSRPRALPTGRPAARRR
jgi:hypothetical protein